MSVLDPIVLVAIDLGLVNTANLIGSGFWFGLPSCSTVLRALFRYRDANYQTSGHAYDKQRIL